MKTDGPTKRRRLLLATAIAAGAVAAVAGMELVPPVRHEIGPTTIAAKGVPGLGHTNLLIPPLGRVEADTHPGPLSIDLSLVEVDIPRLTDQFESDPTGSQLAAEIERDLRGLAIKVAIRVLLGGAILGTVALALLPHRRRRYVIAGGVGGTVCTAVLLLVAATSFSADAFEEPKFSGALSRAPVVIEALNKGELAVSAVQDRFAEAADRLTDLLTLLDRPDIDPRHDSVAILHISDVHSNPVGLEIAQQLARQFEVDAVLDTGDLTNFGVALETRFAMLVRRFDVPYVYVPGNHDSRAVQLALATLDDVTILDGGLTEVAGIRIQGFRDPTYTNWNALPPKEAAALKLERAPGIAERVGEAEPDVLAVHDHRLAANSFGLVPLILSGHYHKQISETDRGTRLLGVGTTGAAGLQSFTVETNLNYEAQIIYFRDSRAVALDYVRFEGLGNNFVIERTTLEELGPLEPPEGSPSPSPSGTPAGSPSPS